MNDPTKAAMAISMGKNKANAGISKVPKPKPEKKVNPETISARKHIGNRFEELIRIIINSVGLTGKKIVLNIPYKTDEGVKNYRCETDFIISPYKEVKSTTKSIDPNELIISTKTTTKDRMSKIFIDKILIQNFVGNEIKVVGISVNDIQRKDDKKNEKQKISQTFLSNLFMVYKEFLVDIEGYYYFDLPEKSKKAPYKDHIFYFSKFLIEDVWKLISTSS